LASSVLPTPAGPSTSSGLPRRSARKTVVATAGEARYPASARLAETSSTEVNNARTSGWAGTAASAPARAPGPIQALAHRSVTGSPGVSRPHPVTGRAAAGSAARQHDLQGARPVHPLHPVQLDVAGRRGTGDPGQRPGRVEPLQGPRDGGDDLPGDPHDADVVVGHQGDPAPPLVGGAVQHD